MPITRKDNGQRLVWSESAPSEAEAFERLVSLWEQIPEGYRLKVASLKCPTDRGRRVSLYLEVVSPEWVNSRRQERSQTQRE